MSSLEEQKTLPFGFAKRNGVVIQGEITDTGSSEVICREGLDVQVLAEVQKSRCQSVSNFKPRAFDEITFTLFLCRLCVLR